MIKSILVATDGSKNSNVALEYALYFGEKFSAEITAINVIDIKALEGPFLSDMSAALGFSPYQNYYEKFREILTDRSNVILDGFEKVSEKKKIKITIKRLKGVVPIVIADEGKRFDMIVLAQRGEHAEWTSGLLGSTTESVVRKSLRPVLVTPDEIRDVNTILNAFDGTPESSKSLKLACEVSSLLNLKLKVLIVEDNEGVANNILSEANEYLSHYNLDKSVVIKTGEPAQEIIDYSKECEADLIVMGAFGRGRLQELILGGTTAFVIRKSTIPILLSR